MHSVSIKMAYSQIYFLFTSISLHSSLCAGMKCLWRRLLGIAGAFPAQRGVFFVITIPSVVCRYIDLTSGWQRAD